MNTVVPDDALVYGFINRPVGTHIGKTMMLRELTILLGAAQPGDECPALRTRVIEDNVLLKSTVSNRKEVFKRLAQLYGLRNTRPLYRALCALWNAGEADRPLLAAMCAAARDPLLRSTAEIVLAQPPGATVTTAMLEHAVREAYPGRYSALVVERIAQHSLSTWTQAGHLSGKRTKTRALVCAGPTATAYALLLGHLCGVRGAPLFDTFWTRFLDAAPAVLDTQAFAASQRGWLEYRRIGDVVEIGFTQLMRPPEGAR